MQKKIQVHGGKMLVAITLKYIIQEEKRVNLHLSSLLQAFLAKWILGRHWKLPWWYRNIDEDLDHWHACLWKVTCIYTLENVLSSYWTSATFHIMHFHILSWGWADKYPITSDISAKTMNVDLMLMRHFTLTTWQSNKRGFACDSKGKQK